MATYVIGDVHGCFEPLQDLLGHIQFDRNKDFLMFTGDLVNRGPQSLQVLRFVESLGVRAVTVLGNHDLVLIAVAAGLVPFSNKHHNFQDVLNAPDCAALLLWLKTRPLAHFDPNLNLMLVHAGLPPEWDIAQSLARARELESCLQANELDWLAQFIRLKPQAWHAELKGNERLLYIANALTQIRFLNAAGELMSHGKGPPQTHPDLIPWFVYPQAAWLGTPIAFGHWASLQGVSPAHVQALDTGCVWGRQLSALRLNDGVRFATTCSSLVS